MRDARGARWSVAGDLAVLGATVAGRRLLAADYPDALARVWAALTCPTSGDVLLSAAPGWEFPDWGGVDHVGGGSPRVAARVRLARRARVLRRRAAARAGGGRRAGRSRTSRRWSWRISASRPGARPRRRPVHCGRCPTRPQRSRCPFAAGCATACAGATTGGSSCASAPWAPAGTSPTWRPSRWRSTRSALDYRVAAVLAFVVGVTNNFWWNRQWTFAARDGHAGFQAARFFVVSRGDVPRLAGDPRDAGARGVPEVPAQAHRDRGLDAAELPRQQALELPRVRSARAALLAALASSCLVAGAAAAHAQTAPRDARRSPAAGSRSSRARRRPSTRTSSSTRPTSTSCRPGMRLTGRQVQAIADRVPLIVAERRKHQAPTPGVFRKGAGRWQVSYYDRHAKPPTEIGQVTIDDATGQVVEAWTGYKVAWTMARGYAGRVRAQGELARGCGSRCCVLFVAAFLDWRRPLRLLHLDLLVLVAFGVSVAFFNDAQIDVSVPLVYPLLAYLLARMLWIGLRSRPGPTRAAAAAARPGDLAGDRASCSSLGFRIGLNVTNSNVIDVGYSGVIGADKLDARPAALRHVPEGRRARRHLRAGQLRGLRARSCRRCGWSGRWDDLPAAHAAALVFDLLSVLLLFLSGAGSAGRRWAWALAYAWCAYPFTLYVANCNSNDALVSLLVLAGALASRARRRRAGAAVALGGLTKFAPLALAPLFAFHARGCGRRTVARLRRRRSPRCARWPWLPVVAQGESLSDDVRPRRWASRPTRGSPFSIWGLYHLDALQHVWQLAAVVARPGHRAASPRRPRPRRPRRAARPRS